MTTNHVAIQILHGVTNVTSAKRPNQRVLVVVAAEEEDMAVVGNMEVVIEETMTDEVGDKQMKAFKSSRDRTVCKYLRISLDV